MNRPVREGDVIAAQYLLDARISESAQYERWLATRQQIGDRVCLTFLQVDEQAQQEIKRRVDLVRGLVHENITVPSLVESTDDHFFVIEPYFRGGVSLAEKKPEETWAAVRQLLTAVTFFHDLGVVHGNIQPANILINENGDLRIGGFADFGQTADEVEAFLSPQVKGGATPDTSDDIFALAQLLYLLLTGTTWKPGLALNSPLPSLPANILQQMLSENSLDRKVSLPDLKEALAQHFEPKEQSISSASFSRPPTDEVTAEQAPVVARRDEGVPASLVIGGLALLIVLAGFGFLLLPDSTSTPNQPVAQIPVAAQPETTTAAVANGPAANQAAPTLTPMEVARQEHLKAEGERIGREILKRQIQLEDSGVGLWAAETYADLTASLDVADVTFRENRFEDALTQYESVLAQLEELIDSIPDVLSRQIELGAAAIIEANPEAAMTAYTIATRLAPEDKEIEGQLLRAENLAEVLQLTNRAEVHERNNELDEASRLFIEASNLDPAWQPANEGRRRTAQAIQRRDFRHAMSRGFQGIAARDYEAARSGFNAARKILPESDEPADGLLQIEQAERNDHIEQLRLAAREAVEQFDWQTALTAYEDALSISPSLQFAQQGKQDVLERIELESSVERLLRDPTLLQDNAVYAEAARLIRAATRLGDNSERFQQDVGTLAQLVSTARIELPVTIESNGTTDITVRKYRQLGRISAETVYLIPGKYTIVGERAGYRDVREELVLLPGQPAPVIVVASEERVR